MANIGVSDRGVASLGTSPKVPSALAPHPIAQPKCLPSLALSTSKPHTELVSAFSFKRLNSHSSRVIPFNLPNLYVSSPIFINALTVLSFTMCCRFISIILALLALAVAMPTMLDATSLALTSAIPIASNTIFSVVTTIPVTQNLPLSALTTAVPATQIDSSSVSAGISTIETVSLSVFTVSLPVLTTILNAPNAPSSVSTAIPTTQDVSLSASTASPTTEIVSSSVSTASPTTQDDSSSVSTAMPTPQTVSVSVPTNNANTVLTTITATPPTLTPPVTVIETILTQNGIVSTMTVTGVPSSTPVKKPKHKTHPCYNLPLLERELCCLKKYFRPC